MSSIRHWAKVLLTSMLFVCASSSSIVNSQLIGCEKKENLVLEDVIVTARKQFDVVLNVPISMTVIGAEQLTKTNTLRLEDMSIYVPNLFVGQTPIANQLFIRGVGSGVNKGFEQTVGTYIDGIYYGRGQLARIPFFDIQRIEVLKGPQGILFGKNTVAGALSITTADPASELNGHVNGLYEVEHSEYRVDGAVSGAISDEFNGRIAFRQSGMGGWLNNNVKNQDETDTEESTVRLSLSYEGIENTSILAKYTHGEFDVEGSKMQIGQCSNAYRATLASNNVFDDCKTDNNKWSTGEVVTSLDGNHAVNFGSEWGETNYDTVSIEVDIEIGEHTLSLITGYLAYDFLENIDNDYSALSFVMSEQDEEFKQLSQEIRFSYTAEEQYVLLTGLYWQSANLNFIRDDHINLQPLGNPASATKVDEFEQDASTLAVFSQLQWFINERWSSTLGMRYSYDEKEVEKQQIHAQLGSRISSSDPNVLNTLAGFGFSEHKIKDDRSDGDFSPSINIQWQPDASTMAYGSVSNGFKSGGFDAASARGDVGEFEYDKEQVTAYEVGLKLRLLEGGANLNIALFQSEFSDVQVSTFDGVASFKVGNAGKLTTEGIEIDGRILLSKEFELGIAATWLEAQYDEFPGAACYSGQTVAQGCVAGSQDLSGKETQFSPEVVFNVYAEYRRSFGDELMFGVLAEALYSDEFWVANDLDPNLLQESYTKYNLRFSIASTTNIWELALIAKNITDEDTISWGNDVASMPGSYFTALDRGYSLSVQASYHFN